MGILGDTLMASRHPEDHDFYEYRRNRVAAERKIAKLQVTRAKRKAGPMADIARVRHVTQRIQNPRVLS